LNDDKTIGFYRKSFTVNQFEDLLYNGNKIVNSSMVIRRSLLLDIHGLDEDKKLIGVEDYDLTIRLAQINAKFLLVNKILGEYRLNDTNISADYFKQLDKLTYLLSRYKSSVSKSGKLKMAALIDYLSGSYYLRNEQVKTGKKKLWTSFLYGSFQIKMKSFIKILTSF
jgi:GT2 family glycosyltransferase